MCQALVMSSLMLRPLTLADEEEFRAAHKNMNQTDGWTLGLGLEPEMGWAEYVELVKNYRLGVDLPDIWCGLRFSWPTSMA